MKITAKQAILALIILAIILLIIIISLLTRTAPAPRSGVSHYVSPGAGGSSPCAIATPCGNLQAGANSMAGGDTLYLRGGTYSTSVDHFDCNASAFGGGATNSCVPSGTSGAPTIIKAYPGETAIVKPTSVAPRIFDLEGTQSWITLGASDGTLIFDGTNIGYQCVQLNGTNANVLVQYMEIRYCGTMSGSALQGIGTGDNTTNDTFTHNYIHNIGMYGSPTDLSHGIYPHGSNHTVSYNQIDHIPGAGVHVWAGTGVSNISVIGNIIHDAGTYMSYQAGILISSGSGHYAANNIIYSSSRGVWVYDGCSSCVVINNTVVNNTASLEGIRVNSGTSVTITNNIFRGNSTNFSNLGGTVTCATNIGMTSGCANDASPPDPLFNNTTGNTGFRLTGTGPAIGTGTNLTSTFGNITDVDGVDPRPGSGAWDIGADQYVAGSGGGTLTLLRSLTRPAVIGNGSPSGAVYCNPGDLFIQLDGSATHKLWICTNAATLAWEQQ